MRVTDEGRRSEQAVPVLDYSHGQREGAGALPVLPAEPPPIPLWLLVVRWILALLCIAVVSVLVMVCAGLVGRVSSEH